MLCGDFMKKNIRHLSLRIDDETLKKFRYICEFDGRSANGQLLVYIRTAIRKFEEENGEISVDSLRDKL